MELNLGLIFLPIALAGMGLYFDKGIFTFISGILFLFIGLTSGEIFFMVAMIGLALFQFFSAFFEYRRP